MPPKPPLRLTDGQLDQVMRIAQPLHPRDRSKFLEDVALSLGVIPELGDGVVGRVCREVQSRYWRAPELARTGGSGKYR
jgi:hypothetical protein